MPEHTNAVDTGRHGAPPRQPHPSPISLLWYSVAALAALDVGVGLWFHLHAPQILALLPLTNVTIVGVGGLATLLPSGSGDRVRHSAVRWLKKPAVARGLWGIFSVLLLVGLFVSSVSVKAEGGGTLLYTVSGAEGDSTADGVADTLRLTRADPEVHRLKWIFPLGRRIWAFSAGYVTKETQTMVAWRPARWSFPDDFDTVVTVTFLPAPSADFSLRRSSTTLILRESDNSVLLEVPLDPHGVRVQFSGPPPMAGGLAKRWVDSLFKLTPNDTAAVRDRLKVWQGVLAARPRRPLHQGERVTYEIRRADGSIGPTPLALDSAVVDVLLDAAAVAPPPKTPPGPPPP